MHAHTDYLTPAGKFVGRPAANAGGRRRLFLNTLISIDTVKMPYVRVFVAGVDL